GRPRGGYLTGFVVGFTESIFDKIDIFERLGIFASSEILADCVTRPKNSGMGRESFLKYYLIFS
ncbi:MAG: hypothetical protein Q7V05_01980, partial [Methanoregula sp.]|nr:hypothetical protein [Methanoregula sp.]